MKAILIKPKKPLTYIVDDLSVNCFLHRSLVDCNPVTFSTVSWSVTEKTTGLSVGGPDQTMKAATTQAGLNINKFKKSVRLALLSAPKVPNDGLCYLATKG